MLTTMQTCVLHKCDLPICCNPSHLFLGSNQANHRDKAAKGRHHNSVLCVEEVRAIRAMAKTGRFTNDQMAEMFGVASSTISLIINRHTWVDLL